jgi:DNA-directed RNA polymerase specialized sigma24 family protein
MPDPKNPAPASRTGDPLDDADAPVSSARPTLPAGGAPEGSAPAPKRDAASPPRVSDAVLRSALARKETQDHVVAVIRRSLSKKTPRWIVDEILSNVNTRVLTTLARPTDETRIRGWLTVVAVSVRNSYFRAGAAHAKWINPEADLQDVLPESAEAPAEDAEAPSWLIAPWLEKKVAESPKDREAYDIIRARAGGATYDEIAAERGESASALAKKVQRFKDKYVPLRRRYNERRHALLLLLKLFGLPLAIAGIAVALYFALRPRPPRPAPSPAPSASVLPFNDETPGVATPPPR